MIRLLPLALLALLACDKNQDSGDAPPVDDTGPVEGLPEIGEVQWALHDEVASLVTVTWEQQGDAEAWVEYSFDEGEWLQSPAAARGDGAQEQLLVGVPYETELSFRVVLESPAGRVASEDQTATTGALLEDLPVATVAISEPERWDVAGRYLFLSIGVMQGLNGFSAWRVMVDRQGRVVWARKNGMGSATFWCSVSRDGDDLLFDDTRILEKLDSHVYRTKIDGTLVASYDTPGLHHAFLELPDESILWGDGRGQYETLEILHPDGSQESLWSCRDFEEGYGLPNGWCQSNALFWHEDSDTLLYSFYSSMTVVELDPTTGQTLRSFGQLSDWSFDPAESQFDWQHGVSITGDGTLLLSTHASASSIEGVTREYELDDDSATLRQVWSFGEGDGIPADSYGEAHRLPGGNTLQNYGTTPRVREFTTDGEVVWDVSWTNADGAPADIIGRSIFLDDLYAFAP
jgi:hypothetical protein